VAMSRHGVVVVVLDMNPVEVVKPNDVVKPNGVVVVTPNGVVMVVVVIGVQHEPATHVAPTSGQSKIPGIQGPPKSSPGGHCAAENTIQKT